MVAVDPLLLSALADPATYGATAPVAVHETHASWVFVSGARAVKVKKPVALGFLDYSTLARRHAACREEVRVNRELAGDVYIGVSAVVPTATGFALAEEHTAGAVEYAVQMRSFAEADTLAGLIAAGALTTEHVRTVAARLAAFHRTAPAVAGGRPREVLDMWLGNVRELACTRQARDWPLQLVEEFGGTFVRSHADEIEQRRLAGFVRDGHGDLRCEHVLATPTVRVVDRIEFDPALRHTDIACDLAFLTMDLEALDQRSAATQLVAAYRSAGMDPGGEALRSFYAAHRALVRAKVALIAASERDEGAGASARNNAAAASAYDHAAAAPELERALLLWALSERLCWRARAPIALVVCGPGASGKSTLAAELARRSGLTLLSSDVVRKSAAGLAANERAGPQHYSAQFTRLTYERLASEARLALGDAPGVIVDATCRSRADRAVLFSALSGPDLTFVAVRCEVPLELALERARRRMRDTGRVSDATPEIVAEQHQAFEALDELSADHVLELDTTHPLDAQVAAITRAVDGALERGTRVPGR